MRRRVKTTINRLLAGIVLLAGAGIVLVVVADDPDLLPPRELTPAETVAFRFTEEFDDATASLPSIEAAMATDGDEALFDPRPTYQLESVASEPATLTSGDETADTTAVAAAAPAASAAGTAAPALPAAADIAAKPVAATKPPPLKRANPWSVLNDAQIASIKRRLNLTHYQEPMWPSVEAALRRLSYRRPAKNAPAKPDSAQLASVDLSNSDLDGLKSAAVPLIMSMNDEQKNELRMLAHIMGLEKLAAQF